MLKAVIFDMDGVIIDSEPLHIAVVLDMLKSLGIGLSRDALLKYIGIANSRMWKELADEYAIDTPVDELIALQHRMNINVLNNHAALMVPGIVELLEEIKKNSLKTAIASSSTREYIGAVVDRLHIALYFDTILSGEEVIRGKPKPDIFLKTAELLGVSPGECVVIEDSDNGVRAARDAGMKVIGFRNLNSGNQSLAGADYTVNAIREITIRLYDFIMTPELLWKKLM